MPAIVSHKYRFIFPHVPGTGGTSVSDFVAPHFGEADVTDNLLEKHQSMRVLRAGFRRDNVFNDYNKFAVVRDPIDRFIYLHQGWSPKCTLPDMVYQIVSGHAAKQHGKDFAFYWSAQRWLCDTEGKLLVDKVFKFEDGFEPIVQFLNTLGVPGNFEDFPQSNKGPLTQGKRDYYEKQINAASPETLANLYDLYKWDFEKFNYPLAGDTAWNQKTAT